MAAKIGDKVIVNAYNPGVDQYEPTEVIVMKVSFSQGYETVQYKNPHCLSDWFAGWGKPINPDEKTDTPEDEMTNGQLATKHGISLDALRKLWLGFVENEGYTSDGQEHENFVDYVDYVCRLRPRTEPFDGGRGVGTMGQIVD